MKTLLVSKVKKHKHIVGQECQHKFHVKEAGELRRYIGHHLRGIDSELYDEQLEDIENIFNLTPGDYTVDLGDFYLNVEIKK